MTNVALASVCDVSQGGKLKLSGKHFVEDGYAAYGAGGLNGRLTQKEFDRSGIVLSAIGARCGKCFQTEDEWTSLANTQVLFPHEDQVDATFLFHQLNDEARWPRSGAAQPFIRPSDVKAHQIWLPPLAEQRRIVEVLDEAFAVLATATANTQQALTSARELFESLRGAAFRSVGGDHHVPLGDCVEVLDRLRRPITKCDRKAGPFPYYGASGVLDHVASYIFDEPLVLLGEDGAKWESGERSAFHVEGKCWVNNHAHVLKPDPERLSSAWLVHYLNHANLLPFITGLTVPKLNQGMMRTIPVPLPALAEQANAAARLDGADDLVRQHEEALIAKLNLLAELRQSLLARAFAGELT